MAFARLEPFGSDANYLGYAIVAATVANAHRGKGQKAYEVNDFMPVFREVSKEQSVEAMQQIAEMMTIGLGGTDLRNKD